MDEGGGGRRPWRDALGGGRNMATASAESIAYPVAISLTMIPIGHWICIMIVQERAGRVSGAKGGSQHFERCTIYVVEVQLSYTLPSTTSTRKRRQRGVHHLCTLFAYKVITPMINHRPTSTSMADRQGFRHARGRLMVVIWR